MPRKKLPNYFLPSTDDLLFTQEGFTLKFCRQLVNNGAKGHRTIGLAIRLRQSAPLFKDAFAKVLTHRVTSLNLRARRARPKEAIARAY